MQNIYHPELPLDLPTLSEMEARRENDLARLLAALVTAGGVASGLAVTVHGNTATVSPGVAVAADEGGALRVVRVTRPQNLTVPAAPGAYRVNLNGSARVYAAPRAAPTDAGGALFYEAFERDAYAPGQMPAALGLIVTPGIGLGGDTPGGPGLLPLARLIRAASGALTLDSAFYPPALGTVGAGTGTDNGPAPAPAPAFDGTLTRHLNAAGYNLINVGGVRSPDDTPVEVNAAELGGYTAQEIIQAAREGMTGGQSSGPRTYTIRVNRALDADHNSTGPLWFALPVTPGPNDLVTYNGGGTYLGRDGATVSFRPIVLATYEAEHYYTRGAQSLRHGTTHIDVVGPNAGIYVSTVRLVEDAQGNAIANGNGLYEAVTCLERLTPGVGFSVAFSYTVALPPVDGMASKETGPAPEPVIEGGRITLGGRDTGIAVNTALGSPTATENALSNTVAGRRVRLPISSDGVALDRLTVQVIGTLGIVPASSAPLALEEIL